MQPLLIENAREVKEPCRKSTPLTVISEILGIDVQPSIILQLAVPRGNLSPDNS